MHRISRLFPALALAALAGCQDQPLAPTSQRPIPRLGLSLSPPPMCPTAATFTVTDEVAFRAALAAAKPGDVIAVRGLIALTEDDSIFTPHLTLTCATPGSGFVAIGTGVIDMLTVGAEGVVVDGLVLDGTLAGDSPYLAVNDGATFFAAHVQFSHNTVTCTPGGECVLVFGSVGSVVTDNHLEAAGSFDGIHLQAIGNDPTGAVNPFRVDSARVERNVLVATTPSIGRRQGAIRPYDADDIVLADNTIIGPWRNGVSVTRALRPRVRGNDVQGPVVDGIRTSDAAPLVIHGLVSGGMFIKNQVTGAGDAGVFAMLACSNTFVANELEGNAGGLGLALALTTGANLVAATQGRVIDDGAFDCDGDGDIDPNEVVGSIPEHGGSSPASLLSETVKRAHGTLLR